MPNTHSTLTGLFYDIADAIRAKTGESGAIVADTFPDAIAAIPSGGTDKKSDVNFYDYDGTIVTSYSAAEFANLAAMPDNPTHEGLTAQGWNWTLADAQVYIADHDKLEIGQTYITSDGKTRLYIHLEDGRLAPYLGLAINGTATVDWGDGTSDSVTGTSITTVINTQHTYASAGDYVIAITVSGSVALMGDTNYGSRVLWQNNNYGRVYQNAIQKVEIGANTKIGSAAFQYCYSLASITIPNSAEIDYQAFSDCYSLTSITIPSSETYISGYAFRNCSSLASITIPSSVTDIGDYAFYHCYSLTTIAIPGDVTVIGSAAFAGCYSLASITIPYVPFIFDYTFEACYSLVSITIPSTVTDIGAYAFSACRSLVSITIPSSVTSIGTGAFDSCYSLASITIPDSVTNIGARTFYNCYSLTSITIPSSVTSIVANMFYNCYSLTSVTIPITITEIGANAFEGCRSLASITIPNRVTGIGANAFNSCYGLGYIKFEPTTPPTIPGSSFWLISTDCIIYVHRGTLSAYTSAANYPSSSTYTYVEY